MAAAVVVVVVAVGGGGCVSVGRSGCSSFVLTIGWRRSEHRPALVPKQDWSDDRARGKPSIER